MVNNESKIIYYNIPVKVLWAIVQVWAPGNLWCHVKQSKLTFFSPNAFMVCLHLPVFLLTGKISQNAWSPRTKHLAYQISTKRVRCLQVKPSSSKLQSVYRSAHSGKFCINKQLRTLKRLYFCLKRFSMFFIFTQYSDFLLAFQKDRTRLIENYDVVEFFLRIA